MSCSCKNLNNIDDSIPANWTNLMFSLFLKSFSTWFANDLVATWIKNTVSLSVHTNATKCFINSFNIKYFHNMLFNRKVFGSIFKFNSRTLFSRLFFGFPHYSVYVLLQSLFLNIRVNSSIIYNDSMF